MPDRFVITNNTPGGNGTTRDTAGVNRAWATQQEAETALSGSAFAEDLHLKCSGTVADVPVVWDNTYVQGGYKVVVEGDIVEASGFHGGSFNLDTYRVAATGHSQILIYVTSPDDFEFIGIQWHSDGYTYTTGIRVNNAGIFVKVKKCIAMWEYTGNLNHMYEQSAGTSKLENCIFEFRGTTSNNRGGIAFHSGTAKIYNCLTRGTDYGVYAGGGYVILKNCSCYDSANPFYSVDVVDYCATTRGQGTNQVPVTGGWNAQYIYNGLSRWTGDFRLRSTSSLLAAGLGPSADSDVPTEDMLGNPRSGSTATVGPFEVSSTVPSGITLHIDTASSDDYGNTGLTDGLSGQDSAFPSLFKALSYMNGTDIENDVTLKPCGAAADTTPASVANNSYVASGYEWRLVANRDKATGYHGGAWNTGTYRLVTSGSEPLQFHADRLMVVDGIQIRSDTLNTCLYVAGAVLAGSVVKNCIIHCATAANNNGIWTYMGAGVLRVENNVIVSTPLGNRGLNPQVGTIIGYQNIIVGFAYGVDGLQGAANSTVFNCTDDFGPSVTADHCASEDGDGTNPVIITDPNDEFLDPSYLTSLDFRVKPGSALLGSGIGPSADPGVPVLDILGNTRSGAIATIGPFELNTDPGAAVVAAFSALPLSGDKPLTVDFTDESTGTPTSWDWDYGDGTAHGTTQDPQHEYQDAGTYTVTLYVENATTDDTLVKTDYITVTGVTAAFSALPLTGDEDLTVTFTDESTGVPTSWDWDFGDSTPHSTDQNPVHVYADGGVYTVTLYVENATTDDTLVKTDYITVIDDSPVAEFSAIPVAGDQRLMVQFTDDSTGYPSSWKWYFGDGKFSNDQNPLHKYKNVGIFTVTLTATNLIGTDTIVKTDYITVDAVTPVAAFSASPLYGNGRFNAYFRDESTGYPTSWDWDFGDGSPHSSKQSPVHEYSGAVPSTVTLVVQNAAGSDNTSKVDYIRIDAAVTDNLFKVLTSLNSSNRTTRSFNSRDFTPVTGRWAAMGDNGVLKNVETGSPSLLNYLVIGDTTKALYEGNDTASGQVATLEMPGMKCEGGDATINLASIAIGAPLVVSADAEQEGMLAVSSEVSAGDYSVVARVLTYDSVAGIVTYELVSPYTITVP